ncbi:MAG: SPFH domain-containing protein [Bacteroidales bacterium]|jgi:regulator of protease activity HflC (stomatin/prohibitin superfamily)|nr:SPFH domain-containing protein [Bacteroidales bacterium]MCI2122192.1 SPFH domain-containing protein [Bacteroidales bacterium]MCI2145588.1 SPFH domain-containing protein [Bacteroidales bacterium]
MTKINDNPSKEKFLHPASGWLMLIVSIAVIILCIVSFVEFDSVVLDVVMVVLMICAFICLFGLTTVYPNESKVVTFFGKYWGTIADDGFKFVNPFTVRKNLSLRARNLNTETIKVNDMLGNPIMIGVVLVWRVKDTYKASFDVDNYLKFVNVQSEAAERELAGRYPYDNLETKEDVLTLRGGGEEVNRELEESIRRRVAIAGIEIIEARINYLAYATEIASAMLQRQQATAIVAARQTIVEGAVGMVQMALDELKKKEIVDLDPDKKAAMVSNLLVVLCSDRAATPVVNAGTLYQ